MSMARAATGSACRARQGGASTRPRVLLESRVIVVRSLVAESRSVGCGPRRATIVRDEGCVSHHFHQRSCRGRIARSVQAGRVQAHSGRRRRCAPGGGPTLRVPRDGGHAPRTSTRTASAKLSSRGSKRGHAEGLDQTGRGGTTCRVDRSPGKSLRRNSTGRETEACFREVLVRPLVVMSSPFRHHQCPASGCANVYPHREPLHLIRRRRPAGCADPSSSYFG